MLLSALGHTRGADVMLHVNGNRDAVVQCSSAVLMARIVHRDGVRVQQADVTAIEHWLCELDPCWPNNLNVVTGHAAIPLDVEDVLFDELQVVDPWTVDAVGYNFRHGFALGNRCQRTGVAYEVRYQITLASGEQAIVRFQLRL
jgi:hypothetical protein